jgi:hypothetical protein
MKKAHIKREAWFYSRHKRSDDAVEEERNGRKQAGQRTAQPAAEREQTGKERAHGEEEANDKEGEEEPSHVEILLGPEQLQVSHKKGEKTTAFEPRVFPHGTQ